MLPRLSTRSAMQRALEDLDERARFHADLARGFAHGLAVAGLTSDHVDAAIDSDHGDWTVDDDGRRIWRHLP